MSMSHTLTYLTASLADPGCTATSLCHLYNVMPGCVLQAIFAPLLVSSFHFISCASVQHIPSEGDSAQQSRW